jgi:hypothetical protein
MYVRTFVTPPKIILLLPRKKYVSVKRDRQAAAAANDGPLFLAGGRISDSC